MTVTEAKKIGSRQGLISVGLGILIAQSIMTFMFSIDKGLVKAFFWFTEIEYWLHILIGIMLMFIFGHLFGQIAGVFILIKRYPFALIGFLTGMAILLATTFLASWVGFFQEGIDNIGTEDNPFFDYIFKPLYWVTLFGFTPALLVGIWFGSQIKRKGNKG